MLAQCFQVPSDLHALHPISVCHCIRVTFLKNLSSHSISTSVVPPSNLDMWSPRLHTSSVLPGPMFMFPCSLGDVLGELERFLFLFAFPTPVHPRSPPFAVLHSWSHCLASGIQGPMTTTRYHLKPHWWYP